MCAQCMTTAMAAVGTASGLRAFIANRRYAWVTPRRLRALTFVLIATAVIVSATFVGGSG